MPQDITLLEEISEQDLSQVNGGTAFPGWYSKVISNVTFCKLLSLLLFIFI